MPAPSATAVDTIAAIATAPGSGGIGIIRLSGPGSADVARALCGRTLKPRIFHFATFRDGAGTVLDRGLAVRFAAPRSYTAEDIVELHAHGSPVVLDQILRRAIELGARAARPGEFTERAFLNGKLDLAQAEAVADLIDASTEAAARSAARSLDGAFSAEIGALAQRIVHLRTLV